MNQSVRSANVGVGQSRSHDATDAATEAATQALTALGGQKPTLVLSFATTGYDQETLVRELCKAFGDAPLSGCSGAGVITSSGSDEGSHALGVMALALEGMKATCLLAENADDAEACAKELARQVRASGHQDAKALLLFADGLTTNCTALLASLRTELPFPVAVVGGTAADAFTLTKTFQYRTNQVISNGVAAVLIAGEVDLEIAVSHGCEPLGIEQTITKAADGWVHEIDSKPAWEFFREYLPQDAQELDALNVAFLCLAERLPEKTEKTAYGDVIIRVPLGLNKESGALFFPGGLRAGTRARVAMRRAEHITGRALESVKELSARRAEPPAALLQFDCLGRGRLLFGDTASEQLMIPMQRAMGGDVPWLGLHTFGEIAPVGSDTYLHNFTVVLAAIYETPKSA